MEALNKLYSLQYQHFGDQDSSPSLLQGFFIRILMLTILTGGAQSRMKLRRKCEPMEEEVAPNCHQETLGSESLSSKNFVPQVHSVCSEALT